MQITLRRLGPIEVLRLGRKIVRDFHRYELAGYHYAERSIFAGRSIALEIAAAGRPCGYLVHELPDPDGLLRVAYLATEPRVRGHGVGQAVLRKLGADYPYAAIYFEVEDPAAARSRAEAELMLRRIGFYDRCGFSLLSFRLTAGPWQLLVMTDTPEAEPLIRRRYAASWGKRTVRAWDGQF